MPTDATTRPEPARRRLRRAGALAALVVIAAALFAACGGGSGDPSASPAANGSSSTVAPSAPSSSGNSGNSGSSGSGATSSSSGSKRSGPAYAQCMRQHGVTDFPDPVGPNQGGFLIPQSVQDNPNFASASQACAALQPQGPGSGGGASSGGVTQAQLLQFAQCMRANGVPNFPDPSANGAVSVQGVDTSSPQFQSALQTCETKTGLQFGGQ